MQTAYLHAFPAKRGETNGRVYAWGWVAQLADGTRLHLVDGGFRTKGSARMAAQRWANLRKYHVADGPVDSPTPTVPKVRRVLEAASADPDVAFTADWFYGSGGRVTFNRDDFGILVVHPDWNWKARKAVIGALWDAGFASITGETDDGVKYVRAQRRGQVELGTLER
jgi:hypothetical protein